MNISGVSPRAGIYSYNSIRLTELRNQQIAASQAARLEQEKKMQELDAEQKVPQIGANEAVASKQNFDAYDFAKTYRPGEVYDLKGADSDINSLDMEKAVSDMGKDQILQQYQYFVGNDANAVVAPHAVENFML